MVARMPTYVLTFVSLTLALHSSIAETPADKGDALQRVEDLLLLDNGTAGSGINGAHRLAPADRRDGQRSQVLAVTARTDATLAANSPHNIACAGSPYPPP